MAAAISPVLNTRGQPKAHDLPQQIPVDAQSPQMQMKFRIHAVDVENAENPGKPLGNDGGKGHARHAPAEHRHKEEIQNNVDPHGNAQKHRGVLLLPVPAGYPRWYCNRCCPPDPG